MTNNRKAYLAANKSRRNAQSRQWYHDNKERAIENVKIWRAEHPEEIKAYNRKGSKKHRTFHPFSVQARSAVQFHKLKDPTFQKPCQVCGDIKSQAHHWKGYEPQNWLDVQWLCKRHHDEVHQ